MDSGELRWTLVESSDTGGGRVKYCDERCGEKMLESHGLNYRYACFPGMASPLFLLLSVFLS